MFWIGLDFYVVASLPFELYLLYGIILNSEASLAIHTSDPGFPSGTRTEKVTNFSKDYLFPLIPGLVDVQLMVLKLIYLLSYFIMLLSLFTIL